MNRRAVLAQVAGLGGVALAGCVANGGNGGGNETDEETPTNTESPTEMPPKLTDSTIAVQSVDCGQQVSEATVVFESDHVPIAGTIWAPDPGWTATLVDAAYDHEDDELAVTVGVEESDEDEMVAQCIAEVDYEVTATFESTLPGRVAVTHETNDGSETVATANRE
jgi:hypothetical protein